MDRVLPLGLPLPLRRFYTEGAARCSCRYSWSPAGQDLELVQQIFDSQRSYYGGADFIPWSQLAVAHGVHTWWDGQDDEVTAEQAEAIGIWRHTVPFIHVGNGDHLGLYVSEHESEMPVVYLCHDDFEHPVTKISPSFDRFLEDWETICYIGPEIWLLVAFLGEDGYGELDVKQEKAQKWRDIFLSFAKAATGN